MNWRRKERWVRCYLGAGSTRLGCGCPETQNAPGRLLVRLMERPPLRLAMEVAVHGSPEHSQHHQSPMQLLQDPGSLAARPPVTPHGRL
jgi:hypothetical protein